MFRSLGQALRSAGLPRLQPKCGGRREAVRQSSGDFSEKSLNSVTLLGRVGVAPQMRGSETNPVVIFTMATNTHYRREQQFQQKTEWHKVSVFKPYLRDTVGQYLKKGGRVLVQGKLVYGEVTDAKGVSHQTTTVVADDVIFVGAGRALDAAAAEDESDEDNYRKFN